MRASIAGRSTASPSRLKTCSAKCFPRHGILDKVNGTACACAMPATIFIIHLHRHTFELTNLAGTSTAGVMKDVVMVRGYQQCEIDLVAGNPGLMLFHCHQQLHMDYGFMNLLDYASTYVRESIVPYF